MTIELSREQEATIERQLASGRYGSRAEVISEALELLDDYAQFREDKLARLRGEVQKGVNSPSEPLDVDDVIAEAEARHGGRNQR